MDALWLLPIHSVGGFVELSTSTRRMFVLRGRRYPTVSPVLLLMRATRSLNMPPVQMSPFLSTTASYGYVAGVAFHSLNSLLRALNIVTCLARFSAIQQ